MALRSTKYDRQLRIWGEHGQSALERAHICVLNCGPTGSEALKNLVLGGIGSFTVVDASKVCASDLGNNYFVDWDSLGQSKAKTVSAFLHELNDAVDAKFVEELPEALLESNPAFFSQFTLVIATQMQENSLLKLDEICRQQNVMLIIARSYGLAGLLRISVEVGMYRRLYEEEANAHRDSQLMNMGPVAENTCLRQLVDGTKEEIDKVHKEAATHTQLLEAELDNARQMITNACIKCAQADAEATVLRQWRQSGYQWTMWHISSLPMGAQLLHSVTSHHFLANILSKLKTERTLLDCSAKRIKLLVV